MLLNLSNNEKSVLDAVKYLPGISVILPFEPKMTNKRELEYRLQRIAEQVERDLAANYVKETIAVVMNKLQALIKNLDYSTYKKSLALFVSPLTEKVYYLDIPVEEKIIIDESFEIRDLVFSKKEIHKYLVLVLSSGRSRLFLGNTTVFVRLASNTPAHFAACRHEAPERVANFSDPSHYKEVLLEKFLHNVDNGLGIILKAYQLPLFVLATERVMGHFRKITRYGSRITGYVHGNFEESSEMDIRKAIAPHVKDWRKVMTDDLLLRLDAARGSGKLSIGIKNVWKAAAEKKGRLLVIEKNYRCAAEQGPAGTDIRPHDEAGNNPFYIKDAVDDVIEKVLENGGDVEFVDEGLMADYGHIALIQYY
jgi:hypothetical protein